MSNMDPKPNCQSPAFVSKAGTYDAIVGKDGVETEVFIVADSPTEMTLRLETTGQLITLTKAVQ